MYLGHFYLNTALLNCSHELEAEVLTDRCGADLLNLLASWQGLVYSAQSQGP